MNPVYRFKDLEITIVNSKTQQFTSEENGETNLPTPTASKAETTTPEIHDLFGLVEAIALYAKDLETFDDYLTVKFNVNTMY
ncbi:MAG: hypothetical protein MK110_03285 [Fuerstiella sp.]|nr:hypothetical protein [Fuerstiella sp.]